MQESFRRYRRSVATKLRKAIFSPRGWISRQVYPQEVMRFGTPGYGEWSIIADERLLTKAMVLSCGAGEDISFDLALQQDFGCEIVLVDPTPRAIEHFNCLQAANKSGSSIAINNSALNYDLSAVDISKIHLVPVAVWNKKDKVKFWRPYFSEHVSHSIVNYQGTSQYLEVEADTIESILRGINIDKSNIVLLKLDIEGAEYSVIEWMCRNQFLPWQVLIEFDEINFPNRGTRKKVKLAVSQLQKNGYRLVNFDGLANCTFIRG